MNLKYENFNQRSYDRLRHNSMNPLYYRYFFLQLLFLEANPLGVAFLGVQIAKVPY